MNADTPQVEGSPVAGATLSPTPAQEWKQRSRDASGFMVTLPSGLVARVTRKASDFMTMIKENRIPNPLSEIITRAISGNPVAMSDLDGSKMSSLIQFVDNMCCQMMLEPKCVQPPLKMLINPAFVSKEETPDEVPMKPNPLFMDWQCPDDAITPEDMDLNDRFFLFNVAIGGPTDLESFRKGQVSTPPSAPHGEGVLPEAVVIPPPPGPDQPRPAPGVVL